jgi:hypothetical protein
MRRMELLWISIAALICLVVLAGAFRWTMGRRKPGVFRYQRETVAAAALH